MKNLFSILILSLIHLLFSCSSPTSTTPQKKEHPVNLEKYYSSRNLTGSFILTDLTGNSVLEFNKKGLEKALTPASTFKICNTLIGIEIGIIPDKNFIIPWDSINRRVPAWNQDTDLEMAFKNSTVWYYQELAKRVGIDSMKYWLDRLDYGNKDTSGGITQFWLTGGLRTSPLQQVNFLNRLVKGKLPIKEETFNILKEIMTFEQTENYTLYGKTGWGFDQDQNIGWFVGYIETKKGTFIFSNCIQTYDDNNFGESRIKIVYDILKNETSLLDN